MTKYRPSKSIDAGTRKYPAKIGSAHTQALLPSPPKQQVEVDAALAPLLAALWRKGYRTQFSCEGNLEDHSGRLGYIMFADELQAVMFAGLAGPANYIHNDNDEKLRRTQLATHPIGREWVRDGRVVRFPPEDIPRALACVRRAGWTPADLIGAGNGESQPRQSAPRTCPACDGPIPLRVRRDATYCSRACQLANRDRRQKGAR